MTRPRIVRPLTERVERFRREHAGFIIAAPWATASGKWEVSEPGRAAKAWDSGHAMMDDLEARYPLKSAGSN